MSLTANQIHILRHSLGLDENGHGRAYRNYYCANLESDVVAEIQDLVLRGLMSEGGKLNRDRDQYFHVTEAGKTEALKGVIHKRLTRDQKRYQQFLDADSGLRFIEWLKARRYEYT